MFLYFMVSPNKFKLSYCYHLLLLLLILCRIYIKLINQTTNKKEENWHLMGLKLQKIE